MVGTQEGNGTSTWLLVGHWEALLWNSLLPPYFWSSALVANVMPFSVISYFLALSSPKCLIDLRCPSSSLSLLATDKIKPVNVLESSSRSFLCALGCSCSLTLCCPLVQLWLWLMEASKSCLNRYGSPMTWKNTGSAWAYWCKNWSDEAKSPPASLLNMWKYVLCPSLLAAGEQKKV